jgi:hypothetical protein
MDGVYNLSLKFLLETPGGEPCPICGKEWKAMAFDWMPFSVGVVIDQTRAPVCRSCAADYLRRYPVTVNAPGGQVNIGEKQVNIGQVTAAP